LAGLVSLQLSALSFQQAARLSFTSIRNPQSAI
jgi:hypothetical protein